MEDLGDLCGLDYDTAYFMKYGKRPPAIKEEKTIKCFDDAYLAESLAYEIMYEPDEYYCWQGTRIPQWFE